VATSGPLASDVLDWQLPLAKLTGQVLAAVPGATFVDAVVVASAAQRGDLVLTSDVADLGAIRDAMFPSVRLRRV
jgi:hypothetical protein